MNTLQISYGRQGNNGRLNITARLGDDLLAADTLNINSARARDGFVKQLCKDRDGIDSDEVRRELLRIVDELDKSDNGESVEAAPVEIDVSRILRPERFIHPQVSGLTVPVASISQGSPQTHWRTYLRWADGTREAIETPESLSLPDGANLWLMPTPGAACIRQGAAWSKQGRDKWLAGEYRPDPADVFKRTCEAIERYIDFPPDSAKGTGATLALWAILTYFYPAYSSIPYIYLGGPIGSGKSRVLEVLGKVAFRPLSSSNMTAPAMFRTLHSRGGTLLYDEAERLKESTPDVGEINSMLLAGYKAGGSATRLEPVGDTFKTVEFEVYGPKAIACIYGLPDALSSRCISVMMFRANKDSPKPRRRIDANPERWRGLRDDLHALAMEYGTEILSFANQDVCPAMSGRDYELWQPLLALAAWIEGQGAANLLHVMQEHAGKVVSEARSSKVPDFEEIILHALAQLLKGGKSPTSKEVLDYVRQDDGQAFMRWTSKGISRALGRFGIKTHKSGSRREYRDVSFDDLRRIQEHYAMELDLPPGPEGAK